MCREYRGLVGGTETRVDLEGSDEKLQVLVFYPGDWDDSSAAVLAAFAALTDQFSSCHAALYACSPDSVKSHLSWSKTISPALSLLSDPSGELASRFGLYDEEVRECLPGVVMLDSKGCQLEVVTSSLAPADLAAYCLDLAWRTAANEDFKACNLANYVQDVSAQLRKTSAPAKNVESRSRFLKRGDPAIKARAKSTDALRAKSLHRMEDRMARGYF